MKPTPTLAAAAAGAAAFVLVLALGAPLWGSVLAGAASVLIAKTAIDRSAA